MTAYAATLTPLLLLTTAIPAAARPVVDGTVQTHDSADGRFKVWYALDGADALTAYRDDEDPLNGVPDAVDQVVDGLGACWEQYVTDGGWRPPGDDLGAGGDSRIDVYLRHLTNNGLATHEWAEDHWAAYLQVDPGVGEFGAALLSSVAAHELHHGIQYSYTVNADTWVSESSATYAQYTLYADSVGLQAALQLLWGGRIEEPWVGLTAVGDRLEYGAMVWIKFLVDRAGADPTVFLRWWEILAAIPAWDEALEELAVDMGAASAAGLHAEYAEWLYFACARNDGQHWLDDGLGCILDIETPAEAELSDLPALWEVASPPQSLATAFARLAAVDGEDDLEIACDGPDARWAVRSVWLDEDGDLVQASTHVPEQGRTTFQIERPQTARGLVLALANVDGPAGADWSCSFTLAEGTDADDEDPGDTLPQDLIEEGGCRCGVEAGTTVARGPAVLLVLVAGGIRRLRGRRSEVATWRPGR